MTGRHSIRLVTKRSILGQVTHQLEVDGEKQPPGSFQVETFWDPTPDQHDILISWGAEPAYCLACAGAVEQTKQGRWRHVDRDAWVANPHYVALPDLSADVPPEEQPAHFIDYEGDVWVEFKPGRFGVVRVAGAAINLNPERHPTKSLEDFADDYISSDPKAAIR